MKKGAKDIDLSANFYLGKSHVHPVKFTDFSVHDWTKAKKKLIFFSFSFHICCSDTSWSMSPGT